MKEVDSLEIHAIISLDKPFGETFLDKIKPGHPAALLSKTSKIKISKIAGKAYVYYQNKTFSEILKKR